MSEFTALMAALSKEDIIKLVYDAGLGFMFTTNPDKPCEIVEGQARAKAHEDCDVRMVHELMDSQSDCRAAQAALVEAQKEIIRLYQVMTPEVFTKRDAMEWVRDVAQRNPDPAPNFYFLKLAVRWWLEELDLQLLRDAGVNIELDRYGECEVPVQLRKASCDRNELLWEGVGTILKQEKHPDEAVRKSLSNDVMSMRRQGRYKHDAPCRDEEYSWRRRIGLHLGYTLPQQQTPPTTEKS